MSDDQQKITDEVYMYMLDDIQSEILRARNKMISVALHLANHPTTARFKAQDASNTIEKMKAILEDIDQLPVLPVEPKS